MANSVNIFDISYLVFTGNNGDFTSQNGNLKINPNVPISGITTTGIVTSGFRMPSGATAGANFVSDAFGNGSWKMTSGISAFKTVTGSYSVTASDSNIYINASGSGNLPVITLMPTTTIMGKIFTIKKIDTTANVIVVSGSGIQTIDGSLSFPLIFPNQSVRVQADGGTAYYVI